jgi:hypothetical protein
MGLTQTHAVFVSKAGNDSNTGRSYDAPKLTITSAIAVAGDMIAGGSSAVMISVEDAGTYQESITLASAMRLLAPAATLVGTLTLDGTAAATLDRHYASANNQNLVNKTGGAGHGFYESNVTDMRGVAGAFTGGTGLRNVSGGSVLFARVGVLFVNQDGSGVNDLGAGFGHIHFWTPDLYLAGNNAIGINATNPNTDFIGYIDHILAIVPEPSNTTGIRVANASAIVKVTATEIRAVTAYNVVSGSLHLITSRIVGTRTGSPVFELSPSTFP